jgi:hypothetical protein
MSKTTRSGLGDALAERALSLARTDERLRALEDFSDADGHVVGQADAEALLRRALLALSKHEVYEMARRALAGESPPGSEELAQAGLVTWDPEANVVRPTVLLIELMQFFETAICDAEAVR